MNFIAIGALISLGVSVFLVFLFRIEATRGSRFAERLRVYADVLVLRVTRGLHNFVSFIGTDFIRQIFHYFFHKMLKLGLALLQGGEEYVRTMMRVNKTLAKNAERQSATRTKLEEIALHKAETALTEEEKKAHRDKMLGGM